MLKSADNISSFAGWFALLALLFWLPTSFGSVWATETGCPEHFAYGEAPDFNNPDSHGMKQELCMIGFAVMHSGATRTPVYVAQQLTREKLAQARTLRRTNSFHAETRLTVGERAELRHYANSGYDRGHMAPSADMPDEQSQYESFSLANMVPQVAGINRGTWSRLEKTVRKLADTHGRVYVITGPIYSGRSEMIGGAVTVPAKLFKVVFIPSQQRVTAFWVENTEYAEVREVYLTELQSTVGMSFFPKAGIAHVNNIDGP